MREEVESAVNFVQHLIRRHTRDHVPTHVLMEFHAQLVRALLHDYHDHWHPQEPSRGSAYRCLRINHKMDPLVARAARLSGLPLAQLRRALPEELTLWIDPREVCYRIGENGSICPLFDDHERRTPDSNASSGVSSLSSSPSSFYSPRSDPSELLGEESLAKRAFLMGALLS